MRHEVRPLPASTLEFSSPSELPRPRRLWNVPIDAYADHFAHDARSVFVRDGDEIVAIDLQGGHERWRRRLPERVRITLLWVVGARVVGAGPTGDVVAWDADTGTELWRFGTECTFLEFDACGDRAIGMCIPESGSARSPADRVTDLVAFDPTSGRIAWRKPLPDHIAFSVSCDSARAYVALPATEGGADPENLFAYDLGSGRESWRATVPHRGAAARVGNRVLVIGRAVTAFRAQGGARLWTYAPEEDFGLPVWELPSHPLPLYLGRLLLSRPGAIDGLDLETGLVDRSWPLPTVGPGSGSRRSGPYVQTGEGRILAWVGDEIGGAERRWLVVWEGELSHVLAAPPVQPGTVTTLAGGVVVSRCAPQGLCGWSVAETEDSEASALPPAERVRLRLERGLNLRDRSMDDLRSIPGYAEVLLALAGDPTSPVRGTAIWAIEKLEVPGAEETLLRTLSEIPPPDPQEGDPVRMLRTRTLLALTRYPRPDVAARLAPLLVVAPQSTRFSDETEVRPAVYRLLAKVGGPAEIEALRDEDTRRRAHQGWSRICDEHDARSEEDASPWMCGGRIRAGPYQISQFGLGTFGPMRVWIRRIEGTRRSPPSIACEIARNVSPLPVRMQGGRIALGSGRASFDPERALLDRDEDGISDRVERLLGTDSRNADTDADGRPDGEDPSPLAARRAGDAPAVVAEAVEYTARFDGWAQGVVDVAMQRDSFSEISGGASVFLHRPLPVNEYDSGVLGTGLRVEDLVVSGGTASLRVVANWIGAGETHALQLSRVGGVWRVVEDEKVGEWIE